MDPKQIIVEAFWFDYVDGALASDQRIGDQQDVLYSFLEWLALRSAKGSIIDLRLIRNQAANKIVNKIMCGDPEA